MHDTPERVRLLDPERDRLQPRVMGASRSITGECRYEIVRQLHEGGMGVVYEAIQHGARGFQKRVAIKVIRPQLAEKPGFLENFIGEARLVADLIHTNIVQTYHLGETASSCYMCMELIHGINLDQLRQQLSRLRRPLPVELAVFLVSRIARGLAYAHSKTGADGLPLGIVHRDINPKNILIAREGDVKLTDFGIAKARGYLTTREGEEVAGRPEYMSPEQADFQVTDRRSDLFSMGIVLVELVTGNNPFRAPTPRESLDRILRMPIPRFGDTHPEIPDGLEKILQRLLQRDPVARYQTADVVLHDLEHHIYRSGYGPTNETLGRFVRELFGGTAATT